MTDTSSNPSQEFWEPHYAKMTRPSGGRVSAVLKQIVEARSIGTALELGCARGDDAIWLAKRGWTVTGVDVAEAALIAARASAQKAGVSDRTSFDRHDLGATFPTGKFELVTAMFFHSPVDFGRVQALRRATETVAKGGLLLVVAHGSRAPWSWAEHLAATARDHVLTDQMAQLHERVDVQIKHGHTLDTDLRLRVLFRRPKVSVLYAF